jgi:hypothetical protein
MIEKSIEWLSVVLTIIGVICTSFDITPLNKYILLVGNSCWLILGFYWKKNSLIINQLIFVLIYIIGIWYTF